MAYKYTADLNTSGVLQTLAPGILVVCCTIRNSTTAIIRLTDARGGVHTTQAGSSNTFDISPSTQFTYQSSAAATGGAQIVFSDAPLPTETTSQQLPPGAITIASGTIIVQSGTVDIGSMPAVTIGSVPAVNIATLPAITGTVTSIPSGTQAVSGTFIDPNVAANTGALLGLITRFTSFFTLAGSLPAGATHVETTANPIVGFGLTATIIGAGRLNVWVSGSGNPSVYLVRNRSFYVSPMCRIPIEKRFAVPIKAGDAINVSWDDAITAASFVLRY